MLYWKEHCSRGAGSFQNLFVAFVSMVGLGRMCCANFSVVFLYSNVNRSVRLAYACMFIQIQVTKSNHLFCLNVKVIRQLL